MNRLAGCLQAEANVGRVVAVSEEIGPLLEVVGFNVQADAVLGPAADDHLGSGRAVQVEEIEAEIAKPLAADNFGLQITMCFRNERLIGLAFENAVP